jgi:hypothetical protein
MIYHIQMAMSDDTSKIIYVYKNNSNRPKTDNFFEIYGMLEEDKFIELTVRRLLKSANSEIDAYCFELDLRIFASKIPIELLGEYVIKKGVFEKHAFKPRKLKKPSRAKVSKSAKKRRNLKNKSKSKSKKRSPKPRRR